MKSEIKMLTAGLVLTILLVGMIEWGRAIRIEWFAEPSLGKASSLYQRHLLDYLAPIICLLASVLLSIYYKIWKCRYQNRG